MSVRIITGSALDVLRTLDSESVQCVVTSPPYYGLRDYGVDGQIGLEQTPQAFLSALWAVFDEVRRVLRSDGLCFVNIGDSYAGSGKGPTGSNGIQNAETRQGFESGYLRANGEWSKGGRRSKTEGVGGIPSKNLLLIPQRFAIGMQDRGWWVRSEIVWAKTSAMPESVKDRPMSAWEPIWMFAKNRTYFYDAEAVRQPNAPGAVERFGKNPKISRDNLKYRNERDCLASASTRMPEWIPGGANLRNYWLLGPEPSRLEHYAGFPTEIPKRCILAGSRKGDTVLDPFLGSGTTALVADRLGRHAIGIELNEQYAEMARKRIEADAGPLLGETVTVEPPRQMALLDAEATERQERVG